MRPSLNRGADLALRHPLVRLEVVRHHQSPLSLDEFHHGLFDIQLVRELAMLDPRIFTTAPNLDRLPPVLGICDPETGAIYFVLN